jgi:hypothetical protein
VIQNATTSGVRALSYTFEVAADTGFNTKVFSRSKVPPGDGGKTAVTLDKLAIGQSYYWRAWADDGANTGAMASSAFMIYPKAVVNAPTPVSPVNNAQVASTTPAMVTGNAATVGPVGFLAYEFQVASDQAFGHLIAAGVVNEGTGGQTTFNSSPLGNGATFFWRVRAADSETTSGWSVTQPFTTPPAAPPPGGGGGGGGGGGTDGRIQRVRGDEARRLGAARREGGAPGQDLGREHRAVAGQHLLRGAHLLPGWPYLQGHRRRGTGRGEHPVVV